MSTADAVQRAVWSELNKRRWFGKHIEDDELDVLYADLLEAITDALDARGV